MGWGEGMLGFRVWGLGFIRFRVEGLGCWGLGVGTGIHGPNSLSTLQPCP